MIGFIIVSTLIGLLLLIPAFDSGVSALFALSGVCFIPLIIYLVYILTKKIKINFLKPVCIFAAVCVVFGLIVGLTVALVDDNARYQNAKATKCTICGKKATKYAGDTGYCDKHWVDMINYKGNKPLFDD